MLFISSLSAAESRADKTALFRDCYVKCGTENGDMYRESVRRKKSGHIEKSTLMRAFLVVETERIELLTS